MTKSWSTCRAERYPGLMDTSLQQVASAARTLSLYIEEQGDRADRKVIKAQIQLMARRMEDVCAADVNAPVQVEDTVQGFKD